MKPMIKIDYRYESDEMTDDEYAYQDEKIFVVTEEMVRRLIMDHTDIPKGLEICRSNFYITSP
ncbi:MAG: hypothetical protein ACI9N9_000046 [Enterobacterales bacterium]|jgi:hypothetical protein